jgi:hypothetical protein
MIATFTTVWAAKLIVQVGPLSSRPPVRWIPLGLFAVALYLLVAPFIARPGLLRRRDTLRQRGTDPEQLLLLMAVGGAAAASWMPVFLIFLRGDSTWLVLPWAVTCFIVEALWCWRLRHVLR